jgi:flagellar protein FliO/FliZ
MLLRIFVFTSVCCSSMAHAADPVRPAYTPPPATAISSGSMIQVILSLLLVLAAIAVVAWILKRINLPQNAAGNALKVLSGVAVGQRERVVLIEVNDTWLVVGVAPGQVTALHTMPKNVLPPNGIETAAETDNKFKNWLKIVMEKRNAA